MKPMLWIRYCGAAFHGYQVQPGRRTVQQTLQDSIEAVLGTRYPIVGCSRTDRGVHAKAFCVTIEAQAKELSLPHTRLAHALNAHLPSDLRVYDALLVPMDFHVRYCEHEKEYEYRIWNSPYENPFEREFSAFVPRPLDYDAMHRAAQVLVGCHDFASFQAAGSKVIDTVRTVSSFTVTKEGDLVTLRVRANGFLYHMVRIFAGTLIDVGAGKRTPMQMEAILAAKDRKQAGFTAPPQGLFLSAVYYPFMTNTFED